MPSLYCSEQQLSSSLLLVKPLQRKKKAKAFLPRILLISTSGVQLSKKHTKLLAKKVEKSVLSFSAILIASHKANNKLLIQKNNCCKPNVIFLFFFHTKLCSNFFSDADGDEGGKGSQSVPLWADYAQIFSLSMCTQAENCSKNGFEQQIFGKNWV